MKVKQPSNLLHQNNLIMYKQQTFGVKILQLSKSCFRNARVFSSQIKPIKDGVIQPLPRKKKPKNAPFAKDLFIGKFDKSMLVFPEVLTSAELHELDEMIQPIDRYFTDQLDSMSIDRNAEIPAEVLQSLKDLGLFGMQIPLQFGGLGLNATQYARINEFCSSDTSVAVTLAAHQAIGLKGIVLYGTDEQKEKYLPKLATGEQVAAFCLTESCSGSDAASIQSRATLSEDGKTYYLNGSKIWISNGGIADVFTVFARTEADNLIGEKEDGITAFIVERGFGGVTSGKPEDKLGIRGSNTCEVHFDNTPIPVENVLHEENEGFKVAMTILNSGRFSMGSSSAGGIRKLMALTCEHAVARKQFGKSISEFGLIQKKFADMAVATYVMESMSYVTAAIIDSYDDPDASVEAAMVKIYSSENAFKCINDALQILGGSGYMKVYPYERYLRDARILHIFEGTNEVLRMYVALTGLQHAGKHYQGVIKKLKNPLENVGQAFSESWKRFGLTKKRRLSFKLYDEVHPLLSYLAEMFEERVHLFSDSVIDSLTKHVNKIVDEQMLCQRLADISIDIYAMTCVLARVSRSKSIGLKNCDHELKLTSTFIYEACERIDHNLKEIDLGKHYNGDEFRRKIAEDIYKNKGYVAEHPLTRNWD